MDDTDKKLLNILQKEFPLTERPFKAVAEKCGLNEEEVIRPCPKAETGRRYPPDRRCIQRLQSGPCQHSLRRPCARGKSG